MKIIATGAAIAAYPFSGKWSPVVVYEGCEYGEKVGPEFDCATKATEWADTYKARHNNQLA